MVEIPIILVWTEDEKLNLPQKREWKTVQTIVGLSEAQTISETFLETNDGPTRGVSIVLQWGTEILTTLSYDDVIQHVRDYDTLLWIKAQYTISKDHSVAPGEFMRVAINTNWIETFHPGEIEGNPDIPATNIITPADEVTINMGYDIIQRRLINIYKLNASEAYERLQEKMKTDE